jgi:hypothetical protein
VVRGLEIFRTHFRDYAERYVLIGGTACELSLRMAGLDFRATKDLDIVLLLESLDEAFVKAFWDFINAGRYQYREGGGKPCYYRFRKPGSKDYPFMLELFSRAPDMLYPTRDGHLTPVPTEGAVSSLSAILLDGDYYRFLYSGRRESDGLSFAEADRLIPLKARAWLDLSARKITGGSVDERDIRKHRNDVFRLYQVLAPKAVNEVPSPVKQDMEKFISRMEGANIDLKSLGLTGTNLAAVLADIRKIYGLG